MKINKYFLISEPSSPSILPQSDPYLSRSLFIIIFYRSRFLLLREGCWNKSTTWMRILLPPSNNNEVCKIQFIFIFSSLEHANLKRQPILAFSCRKSMGPTRLHLRSFMPRKHLCRCSADDGEKKGGRNQFLVRCFGDEIKFDSSVVGARSAAEKKIQKSNTGGRRINQCRRSKVFPLICWWKRTSRSELSKQ